MITAPLASVWTDLGVPLTIAVVAATVAAFWPWLQAWQRGRRFQALIKRELEEVGPHPEEPNPKKPWWEHATKRFVHQEIFDRESVSQNRDFLLDLDPTLVYHVSQLWMSLADRNGTQWRYHLSKLAANEKVSTERLRRARDRWEAVLEAQDPKWLESMGIASTFRQDATLARAAQVFEKRFDAYAALLPLTQEPKAGERAELAAKLTEWFYADGAGLLLSGRAFEQFQNVRQALAAPDVEASAADLGDKLSRLRTDLKIDLGVRQPSERDVAMAWPEEERW